MSSYCSNKFSNSYHHILKREGITKFNILGQERDYCILVSWVSKEQENINTHVGVIRESDSSFKVLCILEGLLNIVHATISRCRRLLVYSTKSTVIENLESVSSYTLRLLDLEVDFKEMIIEEEYPRQIFGQFIYNEKSTTSKLLVFIHQKSINVYEVALNDENSWQLVLNEVIVETFPWAQWDARTQVLFYIHFRQVNQICQEESTNKIQAPTLSALQFNQDIHNESVLNTPINLPLLMFESPSFIYDDDPVPFRVSDSSLNIVVLTSDSGRMCICYHYIFQPVQGVDESVDENSTVHMAYSVTILHQARVVHCTVPSVPWTVASQIKLTFSFYGDDSLLISLPGMFVHIMDISNKHDTCSHIVLAPRSNCNHHIPVSNPEGITLYTNQSSSSPISFVLNPAYINKFRDLKNDSLYTNLSLLHNFVIHYENLDAASEVILSLTGECTSSTIYKLFNEFLISGTYYLVTKMSNADTSPLFKLLPISTIRPPENMILRYNEYRINIVYEDLWNPTVMLLTPHQRLCPFKIDMWSKLWDLLQSIGTNPRFTSETVSEKLMVSLVCYQPEALSRCTTPLSPGVSVVGSFSLFDNMSKIGRTKSLLPFFEVEKCTASKQEHIISVNLRELSVHLVKHSSETGMNINAVASRYTLSQMELSKHLCALVTKSSGILVQYSKGFQLIDTLESSKKCMLFHLLERVMVSAETLAFPLPPGFHSFVSYLGYSTLPFEIFLQYVENNVLQLQIDVVKVIMEGLGDSAENTSKKLQLLSLLPKSRAKRLMHGCLNPVYLVLRAREHSSNILSGMANRANTNRNIKINSSGIHSFCSSGRLSPLETFLNLLTAKACLNELDFNLLAEATIASMKL